MIQGKSDGGRERGIQTGRQTERQSNPTAGTGNNSWNFHRALRVSLLVRHECWQAFKLYGFDLFCHLLVRRFVLNYVEGFRGYIGAGIRFRRSTCIMTLCSILVMSTSLLKRLMRGPIRMTIMSAAVPPVAWTLAEVLYVRVKH